MAEYFENQYSLLEQNVVTEGIARFGPMSSFTWYTDPKRLLFVLSRYKFVAKVLEGSRNVLEVGCGDGFGSRIVKQHVFNLTLSDIDPLMIRDAKETSSSKYPVEYVCHDFLAGPLLSGSSKFDGAYLLDVLEHMPHENEEGFLRNIWESLESTAKVVVGMPSIESQVYASLGSRLGHINCKSQEELRDTLLRVFKNVSMFSMNDEIVHTGFSRMANYVLGVCSK